MSDNENKFEIISFKSGDSICFQDIGMNNFHYATMEMDGIQIRNQYAKYSTVIPIDKIKELLESIGYKVIRKSIKKKMVKSEKIFKTTKK